mmetsp:Transcript_1661/g.3428  ORF Transcript_1661/g.3428 Transcript_1661/m.3428 type:complete len:83 (+) Transcript_1661:60-308(+)
MLIAFTPLLNGHTHKYIHMHTTEYTQIYTRKTTSNRKQERNKRGKKLRQAGKHNDLYIYKMKEKTKRALTCSRTKLWHGIKR